jgi:hypothetical protein
MSLVLVLPLGPLAVHIVVIFLDWYNMTCRFELDVGRLYQNSKHILVACINGVNLTIDH